MGNLVDRCMAGGREATQSAVDLRTIWFVEKVSAEAEAGFGDTGHPARARPYASIRYKESYTAFDVLSPFESRGPVLSLGSEDFAVWQWEVNNVTRYLFGRTWTCPKWLSCIVSSTWASHGSLFNHNSIL